VRVAVVGGGIAGLAAAHRLEALDPGAEVVLIERTERLGGKLMTERDAGFLVEGGADSFLTRKTRGVGLCEELGLAEDLIPRRPENHRTFVRRGRELLRLPEGLTGAIPTNLEALEDTTLLSEAGKARLADEPKQPVAVADEDESVAAFVTRRFGREAYDALVEPLLTGIYGGDGEQLSLSATFPRLRTLEREHGSVLRGLAGEAPPPPSARPPFMSLRCGVQQLVERLQESFERTHVRLRSIADSVAIGPARRYAVKLRAGGTVDADALVLACPAWATAKLLASLDPALAGLHREIPYASSAIVTFAHAAGALPPLDGYGYVVPRVESSDVLACSWSSSKWQGRAPDGHGLLRVYAGRVGGRDVTRAGRDDLIALAMDELRYLGIDATPERVWIQRWRSGMPQYVLGHPERVERIEALVAEHPGLAVSGAAYRGVGIPDCIASGEAAAESVVRALDSVRREHSTTAL